VVQIANGGSSTEGSESVFGTLIEPGKVGIVEHNGKISLIGPGIFVKG
jgi:hypothetical protein